MSTEETPIDLAKILEALQAEKAKRAAARVEAGEVIVVPAEAFVVVTGTPDEATDIEDIKASLLAEAKAKNPGKAVVLDESRIIVVITGVPRATDPEPDSPNDTTTCDGDKWGDAQRLYAGVPTHTISQGRPCESEAGVSEPPSPVTPARCSQLIPTRVWITVQPATEDGFPGRIEEGFYTILDDVLVLTDRDGFQIAEERLRVDDDPDCVARALLWRATAGSDFNRPLPYRPLSIA